MRTLYEIMTEMNEKVLDLEYEKVRTELRYIKDLFHNNPEYSEFKEIGVNIVDKVLRDLNERERIKDNEINACKTDLNKYLERFEQTETRRIFRCEHYTKSSKM